MLPRHRLYVGTIGEGLWRSLDEGKTFSRACDGMFVECHVRALSLDPRKPSTLFLGSETGLYRSDDGADSWSRVDSCLNGLQIWSILLLPSNPDVIVVGTCPSRIFRSTDGGVTWTEPAVSMVKECPRILHTRVTTLFADPEQRETIWAGVEIDGLWKSPDAGLHWEKLGRGLSSQDIHAMAIIPSPVNGSSAGSRRLLVSTNNDMNESLDDGQTWQPLQVGRSLPWSYCRGLAQIPDRPEIVLLGNGDGPPGTTGAPARSTDGGRTWQSADIPARSNSTIWTFAVHEAQVDLVYAASVSGEVYRSSDAGASWQKLPREFGEIRALSWAPAS